MDENRKIIMLRLETVKSSQTRPSIGVNGVMNRMGRLRNKGVTFAINKIRYTNFTFMLYKYTNFTFMLYNILILHWVRYGYSGWTTSVYQVSITSMNIDIYADPNVDSYSNLLKLLASSLEIVNRSGQKN